MAFRKPGKLGWTLITIAALLAALAGGFVYGVKNHGLAMLDWADRTLAGTKGARQVLDGAAYGPLPAQTVDVFVPEVPGPHPVLVWVPGGGWHSGTAGEYHFIGRQFARLGYVTVLAGYRLGSEGTYPRMLEDSARAVRWALDHAAELGGDPQKIYLMGQSAGAYNVVMLGLERQWLGRAGVPDGTVKGVIGLSGPYDFYPFTSDSARNAFGHVPDPALTQPIHYARADAPPILLLTGDQDTTVRPRNSFAMAKALTEAGAPTQAVVIKGATHEDTVKLLAAPFNRDRRELDAVLAFLAAHGAPSAVIQAPGG